MTDDEAETLAKTAYSIWRGQDVHGSPHHWDDMMAYDREPFIFVAKFAAAYPK